MSWSDSRFFVTGCSLREKKERKKKGHEKKKEKKITLDVPSAFHNT